MFKIQQEAKAEHFNAVFQALKMSSVSQKLENVNDYLEDGEMAKINELRAVIAKVQTRKDFLQKLRAVKAMGIDQGSKKVFSYFNQWKAVTEAYKQGLRLKLK